MMSKNEEEAFKVLRSSRSIQQEIIKNFNGVLLKETGDGILAQVDSARDAVLCAISIQQEVNDHLYASLRIGIQLGDVTVENGDIRRQVNIASRPQTTSDPGGIYIPDSVYKAIKANPDIRTSYLGEIQYKSLDYPVSTYAIQGSIFPIPAKPSAKKSTNRSVVYKLLASLIVIYLDRLDRLNLP